MPRKASSAPAAPTAGRAIESSTASKDTVTSRREASGHDVRGRALVERVALVCGVLIVFAAHFRPWEVGFLEEWPLAADWNGGGGLAFAPSYFEWTLSRPLHLFPSFLGLALGNGAPGAIFIVLAVVAAAQLLAVVWALRPVARSFWLSGAVGMFLALHPLWPGGFLQRFLPAQTAALALVISMGLLVRWLRTGHVRWIISGCVTLLIGFAVYPGPAVVAPLLALTMALAVRSTMPRRVWAVVGIVLTSALMTLYSLVITRFISPNGTSYELGNIEVAGVRSIHDLVYYIQSTLMTHGQLVMLGVACIAILGAVLALSGAIPHPSGWLLTGAALVSPAVSVVYFGHIGWLSDIDRLGYVISLALFVSLTVWPLNSSDHRVKLQNVLAALIVLASITGAVVGIQQWQPSIAIQHKVLNALGPVVRAASENEVVSVVDRSTTLGQASTFPLQYLASASRVWNGVDTPVWLCFEAPATLPSGAVYCDPKDTGTDRRLATTVQMDTGTIDIYVGRRESHG